MSRVPANRLHSSIFILFALALMPALAAVDRATKSFPKGGAAQGPGADPAISPVSFGSGHDGGGPGEEPSPVDEWARFQSGCPESASTVIVECGDLGDFHLGEVVAPTGCVAVASGVADLTVYPRAFPAGAEPFGFEPLVYGLGVSGGAISSTAVGVDPTVDLDRGPAGGGSIGGAGADGGGTGGSGPGGDDTGDEIPVDSWVGVVDFADDHGWSTTYAAGMTGGAALEPRLTPLDPPEMSALGSDVTDFNVLRGLCAIVEGHDDGGDTLPHVINMSFGRLPMPGEEILTGSCDDGSFACQLVQVVADLRASGVAMIAAAGNHHDLLFPAVLPDVISVGRTDLLDEAFGPLWEVPEGTDALAPGGHLCLDDSWAAPGGSSYSAALLSGHLAERIAADPQLDPHVDPRWTTEWSTALSCWVIDNPTFPATSCRPALQQIFDGLAGGNDALCWSGDVEFTASAVVEPRSAALPEIPGFDHWTADIQPTPTGDPCVPCEGEVLGEDPVEVMEVNMSASQPLDPEVTLVAIYLKTRLDFQRLDLTAEQLQLVRDGQLDLLSVLDYDWPDPIPFEPSLWYLLSTQPEPDCDAGDPCYWHSSSILIRP